MSPLLANVYLHYVLDLWVTWWRRHNAHGDVIIVRFGRLHRGFEHEAEAQRLLADLRQRLAKFGLSLHPDKTRLIEFRTTCRPAPGGRGVWVNPETFDFLGFTHACGKTMAGRFGLRRLTISKRLRAKLREVKTELLGRRHLPVPEQGRWLAAVVRGHLAHYAMPGNSPAVNAFRSQATWHWYRALRRRSQRTRLNWDSDEPPRHTMATTSPHHASLAQRALRRPHPR